MKLTHLVGFIIKQSVMLHCHMNITMHGHMNVTMHGHMNVTMHGHTNVKVTLFRRNYIQWKTN